MCAVAGCANPVCAKGLCRSHYDRDRYSGSPLKPLRQRMCPQCHTWFDPKRSDQLFCSGRCRVAYKRARDDDKSLPVKPETTMYVRPVDVSELESELVVESFTDSQVVEKCGGLCAKCHELVDVGSSGADSPMGLEFPAVRPDGQEWLERTKKWYESLRVSPLAQRMGVEADWYAVQDLALLKDDFWRPKTKGRWMLASEIRQREATLGITPEARVRLKFDAPQPDDMKASAYEGDTEGARNVQRNRQRASALGLRVIDGGA